MVTQVLLMEMMKDHPNCLHLLHQDIKCITILLNTVEMYQICV